MPSGAVSDWIGTVQDTSLRTRWGGCLLAGLPGSPLQSSVSDRHPERHLTKLKVKLRAGEELGTQRVRRSVGRCAGSGGATEEFVEQVSLGLVVPVSGSAAGVVVAACPWRGAQRSQGPDRADGGQPPVRDMPVQDNGFLAAGASDWCRSGKRLQAARRTTRYGGRAVVLRVRLLCRSGGERLAHPRPINRSVTLFAQCVPDNRRQRACDA